MIPDKASHLGLYGNRKIFEKRLNEGYTEVAFGRGPEIRNERVVAMWAFFNPNGNIATHAHLKFYNPEGSHRGSSEDTYDEKSFKKYCEKNQIFLTKKLSLAEILEAWDVEGAA